MKAAASTPCGHGPCALRIPGVRRLAAMLLAVALSAGCREADPLEAIHDLQKEGAWSESVERLRSLVETAPEDARLHLEYGKALVGLGEATRAIWPLRRATEDPTLAREAGVLLSMALLSSMNPDAAIEAASNVLASHPDDAAALFVRSRAFFAARREEDALNDADRYVELEPDDPQGRLLQLGILVMLEQLGEAEEAIAAAAPLFEALAGSRPEETARFCVLQGVFAWEKGDRDAGQRRLEACLARFPDQPIAVVETVAAYERAGETEQATAIVRSALERAPDQAEFRLMLAERLAAAGDRDGAEAVLLEGARRLEGPGPWLALHDFHVATEDHARAAEAMREALERMPDPPAALRIAYADDLLLAGDLEAAEREAERIPPPGVHLVRGRILLARRMPAAARAELEEGLRLWPDNPSARWLAGRAAEQTGDLPGAIAHYREAVRSDPTRSPAAAELAEIYAAMEAGRDALEFADRHLGAHPADPEAATLLLRISRRFDWPEGRARALAALASMPGQDDRLLAEQARELALRRDDEAALALIDGVEPRPGAEGPETLRARTELELRLGRVDTARSRLERLIAQDPRSVELSLLLAEVLEQTQAEPSRSLELLEAVAKIGPADGRVTTRLARAAARAGDPGRAIGLYRQVPERDRAHADAVLEALALEQESAARDGSDAPIVGSSMRRSAEQRLEAALISAPRDPRILIALARVLAAREPGDARALTLARSALLLGGGGEAGTLLGRLLVERGDFAAAIPVLERAISSLPATGLAPYWLGLAREGLGQTEAARRAFARSLELPGLSKTERARAESRARDSQEPADDREPSAL